MDYEVEYCYSQFIRKKIIESIKLHFDTILTTICLNREYHRLNIYIRKQENRQDKNSKMDTSIVLEELIKYLKNNQLFCEKDGHIFKQDILQVRNVAEITFIDLELSEKESTVLRGFANLKCLRTENCILYENCNIGALKCNWYMDNSSLIYNLDSFNGFEGKYFYLTDSKIKAKCKSIFHLNSVIAKFERVEMDYEFFFLTTDAPKMRKLEIYNSPGLNNKDLLFISGFYNLESLEIDGDVENYKQVEKLEKLREIRGLFCTDVEELERIKEKRKVGYEKIKGIKRKQHYLIMQRMVIQNDYQEFFHKIYVPRLERVKWQDKISSYDLIQIKKELEKIASMSVKERKQISREPKKEYNLFDSLNDLCFDGIPKEEDDCYLVNSRPFEGDGIDYYVLKRKIHIEDC